MIDRKIVKNLCENNKQPNTVYQKMDVELFVVLKVLNTHRLSNTKTSELIEISNLKLN